MATAAQIVFLDQPLHLLLPLRSSHSGMLLKNICPQKKPWCIFQYCCDKLVVKFFEKFLWWSAIFSKFACKAFLLLTTGTEELYFIIICWTSIFVEHLLKAASVFWKAGENSRKIFRIIRQIQSFSLLETSTGHLIF